MAREQINWGRLRAQMEVQPKEDGKVCIFCPVEVSERFHRHLAAKGILSAPPQRALFGRYAQDFLIVTASRDTVAAEATAFVETLPEICYERDVVKPPAGMPIAFETPQP
jgi:hypothetical protein